MSDKLEDQGFDMIKCTGCSAEKPRRSYGESPNGRRKYYLDDKLNTWKGKRCPKCVRRAHTEYMKSYRKRVKSLASQAK
jgi:hypothetical protein